MLWNLITVILLCVEMRMRRGWIVVVGLLTFLVPHVVGAVMIVRSSLMIRRLEVGGG